MKKRKAISVLRSFDHRSLDLKLLEGRTSAKNNPPALQAKAASEHENSRRVSNAESALDPNSKTENNGLKKVRSKTDSNKCIRRNSVKREKRIKSKSSPQTKTLKKTGKPTQRRQKKQTLNNQGCEKIGRTYNPFSNITGKLLLSSLNYRSARSKMIVNVILSLLLVGKGLSFDTSDIAKNNVFVYEEAWHLIQVVFDMDPIEKACDELIAKAKVMAAEKGHLDLTLPHIGGGVGPRWRSYKKR